MDAIGKDSAKKRGNRLCLALPYILVLQFSDGKCMIVKKRNNERRLLCLIICK